MMIEEKIKNLVNERCLEEDLTDCFLVDISMSKTNKLTVFMDSDESITYAKCRKISRYLEAAIEENQWLPEKYTLDVSSPGAEKPLKLPRQYKRHVGRELKVLLNDGQELNGILSNVDDKKISLEIPKAESKKELNFDDIKQSSIIIKFK